VDAPSLEVFKARCSRMELWATWSRGRCPCSWQGVGTRWSLRFLPTLTILWFYLRGEFCS